MLELYQTEGCPNSETVRQTLSALGVSYLIHNPRLHGDASETTTNQQTHEALTTLGGQDQIPYLVDTTHETTLYESDEIVAYLEAQYG